MGLDSLKDGVTSVLTTAKANPVAASVVGGGLALGAAGVAVAVTRKKRKKSSKRKTSRKKSSSRRGRRKHRTRRTPRTAGKGRDRSTKRIRYTKNGQPYVLTRSGKAKFIKRSSAKRSRKRKGGRY